MTTTLSQSIGHISFTWMWSLYLVSAAVIYCGIKCFYNIYLHPLSNYPGPRWAAASSTWYARSLCRGTLAMDFLDLHNKYGSVVRVAPDELSYIEPAVFKEIYGHRRGNQPELEKDKKYHSGLTMEPTILNADRTHHGEVRKLMSHGFSDGSLRAQEPVIREQVHLLMRKLHDEGQRGGIALDMVSWYNFFTFDVIGYLTYGETFDCLTSSSLHTWIGILFSLFVQMAHFQASGRLSQPFRYLYKRWFIGRDVRVKVKTQWELSQAKVNNRIANPPPVPDFMEHLVNAWNSGKLSSNQLNGNAQVLMGAGSETTATLLSGLTFLLITHPDKLQRLKTEIRSSFSSPDEITFVSVNQCRYLWACIEEALRVYPPSPSTHPRYVPDGGLTIGGRYVPENMAVGIAIWAAAKSERNFYKADCFLPERWMPQEELDAVFFNDKREALQPFSYGPRNCIGRNLAYVEMKMVIANLLWHFDLENCEEGNWLDQKIFLVWEKRPLMMKLKPVEH